MRRLVVFWLACAAIGFLAAIGAAFALSLAFDGDSAWRAPGEASHRADVGREGPAARQATNLAGPPVDNEPR